jgi:hypothetical protein
MTVDAGTVGEFFSSNDDLVKLFTGQIKAEEERIEMTVTQSTINAVIDAMKTVHPYEEIAYDIYELMNRDDIK